jgi:glycosyltransferase involved in cell wall biosynthesis
MASGCPAIVPNTGGCPEVAQGAARLINPLDIPSIAEAMLALDRSPDLRARMRAVGLGRVKMFSWDRTAQKTLDVFDSIVSENSLPE